MTVTVHKITRHSMQVLTKRAREQAQSSIILRLYDEDGVNRGIFVFEPAGDRRPSKPVGNRDEDSATVFLDIAFHEAVMDVVRNEKSLYLKLGWTQTGKSFALAQVALDTKKEMLGQFFTA